MSPLLANSRRAALYFLGWVVVGLGLAALDVALRGTVWTTALALSPPLAVVLGLIATSAYFVCRAEPVGSVTLWRSAGRYLLAAATSGGLWTGLALAWQQVLGATPGLEGVMPMLWLGGAVVYLLALLVHEVWLAAVSVRSAQERVRQMQLELRDAHLQALRMQIQPHFLFNSLNSISALTSIDPAAARDMTLELAQFFRATLELSEKDRLPLSEEVNLCQRFLAIEQIRYGDKLRSQVQVSDAAGRALLAPMLIQPLVENAIKHGVRHLPQGGCVTLEAQTRDGWLYVSVRNPVPEKATAAPGSGTGLRNIADRLRSRYGERARLSTARSGGEFAVELALPIQDEV